MRFLLNSVKGTASKVSRLPTSPLPPAKTTSATTTAEMEEVTTKKWGQQCSVTCGCVLRLELGISENNTIVQAQYDAKQVVTVATKGATTSESGGIASTPQHRSLLLTHKGRPMLQPCQCETLHGLMQHTVKYIQYKKLHHVQNCLTFGGHRSLTSFRDLVLQQLGYNHNNATKLQATNNRYPQQDGGWCFDLVEDAVTACVKSHLPAPRRPATDCRRRGGGEEHAHYYYGYLDPDRDDDAERSRDWGWPWMYYMEENGEEDYRIKPPPSNKKWTALDWVDAVTVPEEPPPVGVKPMISDWLSYVDLQQEQQHRKSA